MNNVLSPSVNGHLTWSERQRRGTLSTLCANVGSGCPAAAALFSQWAGVSLVGRGLYSRQVTIAWCLKMFQKHSSVSRALTCFF